MKLSKSTNSFNISSLDRILIIKEVFILDIPEGNNINLSQMRFVNQNQFDEIEITDGTQNIIDDDEGAGTIFKAEVNFRHPKVRSEAEDFISKYRGKRVRLITIDKNENARLLPAGKLMVNESNPEMINYNGYLIQFTSIGETIPYIILDEYYEEPPTIWDLAYGDGKACCGVANSYLNINITVINPDYATYDHYLVLDFNGIEERIAMPDNGGITSHIFIRNVSNESYFRLKKSIYNGEIKLSDEYLNIVNIEISGSLTRFYINEYSLPTSVDVSDNAIISDDIDQLLKNFTGKQWYIDSISKLWLQGSCNLGENGVPFTAEALANRALLAAGYHGYLDNL